MEGRYNVRSPAVKRLMKEAQELSEPTDQYFAQPLEDNLFEWHFTVRGPADSDFQVGIYHGRIILPVDYPMKPPSIIWLTPNGRFETNKKICLSISGHHPESWQPSWSIRTALLAIIGFMPTHPGGAIGSLDYKPEERKLLAKKSRSWKCPTCGDVSEILLDVTPESQSTSIEAQELAAQISFQGEKPKSKTEDAKEGVQKKGESPTSENGSTGATPTSTKPADARLTNNESQNSDNSQTSASMPVLSEGSPSVNNCLPSNSVLLRAQSAPSSLPPCPWNFVGHMPFHNFYYGQNRPSSVSSLSLRFPYPPSHYTTASSFYPPGCALPPGVGMFPCPFPLSYPPSSSMQPHVSINNSSALNSTPETRAQTSVNYIRPPLTCPPCVTSVPQAETHINDSATCSDQQPEVNLKGKDEHRHVFNELLTKVKRVGSEEKDLKGQEEETKEKMREPDQREKSQGNLEKHADIGSDSETSVSNKKQDLGWGVTVTEVNPSDTENSEADAPPLEVSESDPRSTLEKSAYSSTTEVEKLKSKLLQQATKGLRQRQSATISVRAEANDETQSGPNPPISSSGQRIEASSGDSGQSNIIRPEAQGPVPGYRVRETVQRVRERRSPYDFTFFVLIVLFVGTVGILLNRLFRMSTESFPSK